MVERHGGLPQGLLELVQQRAAVLVEGVQGRIPCKPTGRAPSSLAVMLCINCVHSKPVRAACLPLVPLTTAQYLGVANLVDFIALTIVKLEQDRCPHQSHMYPLARSSASTAQTLLMVLHQMGLAPMEYMAS